MRPAIAVQLAHSKHGHVSNWYAWLCECGATQLLVQGLGGVFVVL
jgi:hypothetical protein